MFAKSGAATDWSEDEKRELRRLHEAYPSPRYETECSISEDCDPWCIVHDLWRDQIVGHIARIDGAYMVAYRTRFKRNQSTLSSAIDFAVEGEPILLSRRRG